MNEILTLLRQLACPESYPARLATLVQVEGSSYRRAGARLLLTASGRRLGSISGGCLEEDLMVRMSRLEFDDPFDRVIYDTTDENDLVWGVGTGCHGIVTLALEYFEKEPAWARAALQRVENRRSAHVAVRWGETDPGTRLVASLPAAESDEPVFYQELAPPLHLVIAGAGDDAQPLVQLAKTLGWRVSVFDPRPASATRERFPGADVVHVGAVEDLSSAFPWDQLTVAVIMTHHYRFDLPLLQQLVPQGLPYLGLLGPKLRAERLLRDAGFGAEAIQRIHAPVGLDLGGDGAESVALAIIAEIQATLSGRDGQPLRFREGAIHGARRNTSLGRVR